MKATHAGQHDGPLGQIKTIEIVEGVKRIDRMRGGGARARQLDFLWGGMQEELTRRIRKAAAEFGLVVEVRL